MLKAPRLLTVLLIPALVLLIPLVAMRFTTEVKWTLSDFVLMYVLMSAIGISYRALALKSNGPAYTLGAAMGLGTSFLLIWVNLAVGFIGDDNPANTLYLLVVLLAAIGATVARFEPRGMSLALFATAAVQFAIPLVAIVFWPTDFQPGFAKVLALNFAFVLLFAGSGLLFRQAVTNAPRASAA